MAELAGITYERRGSGTPLVLVHGIGSRWEVWLPVLDALAAHHDVIAVDLPGFGISPRPAPDVAAGVDSLCALLEDFLAQLGVQQPHAAGNSMGGWIVLDMARRGTVASATALDPGGFHDNKDRAITVPQLALARLAAQLSRPFAARLFKSPAGRRAGFAGMVAHPERMTPQDAILNLEGMADAPWFWRTFYELIRSEFADGSAITVPTTIAWGTKDRLLPPHQAARALQRIPAARFVSLTDCGHVPMYDNPALVVETILETTGTTLATA